MNDTATTTPQPMTDELIPNAVVRLIHADEDWVRWSDYCLMRDTLLSRLSAQPAPSGEPVCYAHINDAGRVRAVLSEPRGPINKPLYTAPQAPSVPDGWKPVDAEFFAYHADMGVVFFKTEDEARECCAENLKEERKEANSTGEWSDDLAESIRYGVVLGRAKFVPDNEHPESGDYRMVDNAMLAATPTPTPAPVQEDVRRDAERWRMAVLIDAETITPPASRKHQHILNVYINAVGRGDSFTAAIDAAMSAKGGE